MELILIEDVKGLGKAGSIVNVKHGYAMNFLLPKKLGLLSNAHNKKFFEEKNKKTMALLEKQKASAKDLVEKLSKISCTIAVKVGVEDKLYGAVTSSDISKSLEQMGFNIDKKDIVLEDPIKALGVYQIIIKLHSGIEAQLKVWVVKE